MITSYDSINVTFRELNTNLPKNKNRVKCSILNDTDGEAK